MEKAKFTGIEGFEVCVYRAAEIARWPVNLKRIRPYVGSVLRLFFIAACINPSCGYRSIHGRVPGGGKELAVPMVTNYTAHHDLKAPFTATLRRRVALSGIGVVKQSNCPRLEVDLVMVTSAPGMLRTRGSRLEAVDTIQTIVANATLFDERKIPVLGPRRFEVRARAYSGGNPRSDVVHGERRLKQLLEDLADSIVSEFLSE